METVNVFKDDLREISRYEVDFLPGAWVDIYNDLTIADMMAISEKSDDKMQSVNKNVEIMAKAIRAWNFADPNGELPITAESIKSLPMKLVNWLVDKVTTNMADGGKKKE